jgi:hypothetical protein
VFERAQEALNEIMIKPEDIAEAVMVAEIVVRPYKVFELA